jgi:hypothetical protein
VWTEKKKKKKRKKNKVHKSYQEVKSQKREESQAFSVREMSSGVELPNKKKIDSGEICSFQEIFHYGMKNRS